MDFIYFTNLLRVSEQQVTLSYVDLIIREKMLGKTIPISGNNTIDIEPSNYLNLFTKKHTIREFISK